MASELREDSASVQAHLNIVQSVIQRMSANSGAAKAWCITLVSAILVLVADKDKPEFAWIAGIPILLFLALDTYYLSLEKGFRKSYNDFIDRLHQGNVEPADLYAVEPKGKHRWEAFGSFSIWPFYVTLLGMTALAYRFVL